MSTNHKARLDQNDSFQRHQFAMVSFIDSILFTLVELADQCNYLEKWEQTENDM